MVVSRFVERGVSEGWEHLFLSSCIVLSPAPDRIVEGILCLKEVGLFFFCRTLDAVERVRNNVQSEICFERESVPFSLYLDTQAGSSSRPYAF